MKLYLFILISIQLTVVFSTSDSYDDIIEAIFSSFQNKQINELENIELTEDSGYTPTVETSLGIINGVSLVESHGFYRIPFAKAPINETRFEHSQPIENFPNMKINATTYGRYSCIQTGCSTDGCPDEMTEDCLFLNVHTPKNIDLSDHTTSPSDRLPVFFWIHGGAFQTGSGTSSMYDGRYLSNLTNTVVVSINYRLGAFGFLAFKDGDEVICNQGLKDQQLALRWVQDHIENFGGDKDRVTIAGSSAGAQSVVAHLISENSRPLFHRAIVQSNPTLITYPDVESALLTTEQLLENTNCSEEGIQCLRNTNPYEIVQQGMRVQAQNIAKPDLFGIIEPFRPVIDGIELKENPIQFIQNGGLSGEKEIIIGTDIEEMIYVPAYIPDRLNITKKRYEGFLKYLLGDELGQSVAAKYDEMAGETEKDYESILGEIATDGMFICPSRAMARLASESSNVYLYSFAHAMDDPSCEESWSPSAICGHAFHSSENPFIFRTDSLITYNFSANDDLAANQFSFYWGNFATSGNPSSGDVTSVGEFPEWPSYKLMENLRKIIGPLYRNDFFPRELSSWVNMVIDIPEGILDEDYKKEICDFWDETKYYVDLSQDGTTAPPPEETSSTTIEESTSSDLSTTTQGRLEETTSAASFNVLSGWLMVLALSVNAIF